MVLDAVLEEFKSGGWGKLYLGASKCF